MRKVCILILALVFNASLFSQILEPVKWSYSEKAIENGLIELKFTAKMDDGWHVYSQNADPNSGPIPTSFTFNESKDFELVGKVMEEKAEVTYDPNFEMEIAMFGHQTSFRQKIKPLKKDFSVTGLVSYMTCNDVQCIFPPEEEFTFKVANAVRPNKTDESEQSEDSKSMVNTDDMAADAADSSDDTGAEHGQQENGIIEPVKWKYHAEKLNETEYNLVFEADIIEHWHLYAADLGDKVGPMPTAFSIDESANVKSVGKVVEGEPILSYDPNFEMELSYYENKATFKQKIKSDKAGKVTGAIDFMACDDSKCVFPPPESFEIDLSKAVVTEDIGTSDTSSSSKSNKSLWALFFGAFLSGFAALLTPCVFPMIPMTVSYFTKQSKTRAKGITNAIIYGLFIIVIYVALGVGVSAIFGAETLNNMATNVYFNLAFFILLIVFAVSFLGAFEITLPSSWVNKADSNSDKTGIVGIFFMAFTLALVSFSCTGPIVGTLLVQASSGGYLGPIIGMTGFSLAIALPFTLFAIFPGWMNSLPKSGGWLNSVKVVLGFLELALAFKFLSNADLVLQKHWLEREVFIAIWIVIFGLLTMYLLGFLKFAHDSPLPYISVPRLSFAILTGVFTIYMIPGMWGAPLQLINAFPPPMNYSESPQGVGFFGGGGGTAVIGHDGDHSGRTNGPNNIPLFHDYDEGMEYAKKENLPVMLDFTGWACVNCRKMEQQVWSDNGVKNTLTNDVVVVSLYVDERIELPKEEQEELIIKGKKRRIKYVGDKWKLFQEQEYGTNSQPYYVLIDHNGDQLQEAANYQDHGEVGLFTDWLKKGIAKFKK